MKFYCNKNELVEKINIVQRAITNKSNSPIFSCIFIQIDDNILTMMGIDTDLSIETKVSAQVLEKGKLLLDSRLFGEIIKRLPEEKIKIKNDKEDENNIIISSGNTEFSLINLNSEEYPKIPKVDSNNKISLKQNVFKNMIKSTTFSASFDESKGVITGVLVNIKNNILTFVALDGFRLALKSEIIDNNCNVNIVVPAKTLNEINKILKENDELIDIYITNNFVMLKINEDKIVLRLLQGDFIKYETIIPKENKLSVVLSKYEFINGLERSTLLTKDKNTNLVKLEIKDDKIILKSNSQFGQLKEEIYIKKEGIDLDIAFNSRYLMDAVKAIEDEEIKIEFNNNITPCIIKSNKNENSKYMVLPVRFVI